MDAGVLVVLIGEVDLMGDIGPIGEVILASEVGLMGKFFLRGEVVFTGGVDVTPECLVDSPEPGLECDGLLLSGSC